MDRGNMNPPWCAGDQNDADLDDMLAVSEDRQFAAIHASLDLGAGLAKIIGDPPRPGTTSRQAKFPADKPQEHTGSMDKKRKGCHHRRRQEGSHSRLIRFLVSAVILAGAFVVQMAIRVLVHGPALAIGLPLLTGLAIVGMAWILARSLDPKRRLILMRITIAAACAAVACVMAAGMMATGFFSSREEPADALILQQAKARQVESQQQTLHAATELRAQILSTVLFPRKQAQLTDSAEAKLKLALNSLKRHNMLGVVGYADDGGSPAANHKLSLERAQAVAAFLKVNGVRPGLLHITGVNHAAPAHGRAVIVEAFDP